MGTCCSKDPKDIAVDLKEAHFANELNERASKNPSAVQIEDTEEDKIFKQKAATLKTKNELTNVSQHNHI